MNQKRVLAIHDISCIGKCSLSVALPIISAGGIETSVLPTAVLSTHTGGFNGFTFRDLTGDITSICDHWESLGLKFDAIYTGYLGSFEQLDIVKDIFNRFDFGLKIIDPVMGDHGRLYQNFDNDFPPGMKELCRYADIITPNMTEACLMLGIDYTPGPYTKEFVQNILDLLYKQIGVARIVLTGVYFEDKTLGIASYDGNKKTTDYYFKDSVEGTFHGSGDVFGSALTTALLRDFPLSKAAEIAVNFTVESIIRTKKAGTDTRYGLNFEEQLPAFMKDLEII